MSDCHDLPDANRRVDRHYTICQVAEILAVNHKTIRKLVANHKMDAVKVGASIRIPESALNNYLEESKIKKPPPVKAAVQAKRRKLTGLKFLNS
jgi:excisionase family DNA binding protein